MPGVVDTAETLQLSLDTCAAASEAFAMLLAALAEFADAKETTATN